MVNIVRYWLRRHTHAEWIARNPILGDGEVGLETDINVVRIGDGVTKFLDLNTFVLGTTGGGGGEDPDGGSSLVSLFTYNVDDYNPLPLPTDNNREAIQDALNACEAAGGGFVQLPRGRMFGWRGDIVIPPHVGFMGNGMNSLGLIALDATSRIRAGVWAGNEGYIGSISDLHIDCNDTGHPDGVVQFQSVHAHMTRVQVRDASGMNVRLDAAQNATLLGCVFSGAGVAGLAIENGAGGYNLNGTHMVDNAVDLMIFDGDSSANNAYPFGSAHLNIWGGICENYVDSTLCVDIQCGGAVTFWGTGFSANDVELSGGALVRVNNDGFPLISTFVNFESCNWNGGSEKYPGVLIEGNQHVSFGGISYVQMHDPGFCVVSSGTPIIRPYGTFDALVEVTELFAAINTGSLINIYSSHHANRHVVLPAERPTVISSALDTDGGTGLRYWRDAYGNENWNDASDFAAKQTRAYDSDNDHLLHSSAMISGRFGLIPADSIFADGAVTIDAKLHSEFRILLTGTGSMTSLTIDNPFEGAEITLMIADDTGAHTLNWPANINWNGAAPTTPQPGDWLTVRLIYIDGADEWVPVHVPTPITIGPTAPTNPVVNKTAWIDTN